MALPDFCSSLANNHNDWSLAKEQLHSTAQSFLESLNLPTLHPHCNSNDAAHNIFAAAASMDPSAPPMGPLNFWSYHEDEYNDVIGGNVLKLGSSLITFLKQATPALLAMGELWLRLFAFVVSPLAITYLLWKELNSTKSDGANKMEKTNIGVNNEGVENCKNKLLDGFVCVLGVASSSVLLTDTYYVHEYGRSYGGWMFLASTILSLRWCCFGCGCCSKKHNHHHHHPIKMDLTTKVVIANTASFILLTIGLFISSDGGYLASSNKKLAYPHPGIDLPSPSSVTEGLYYSKSNTLMSSIASAWPEETRTYSYDNGATPYLPTGDSRTGIPFLVNSVSSPTYHRVWVTNEVDGEAVAVDIAFPFSSEGKDSEEEKKYYHDTEKPMYMVLHGLNGGSHEEYVMDFVQRRIAEGSTVAVMIARGLMDTPLRGWNGFHGARISDVDATAKALKAVTKRNKNQILAGVGYSMGAIILGNYVARSGPKCHLDTAMVVSGGLDMREQLNFYRSMRLWQPMLTAGLREDIIMGKFARHYRERLTKEEFVSLLRSTSISELDLHAVVAFNSYDDISHYYGDMSAMGDRPSPFASAINNASITETSILDEEQQYWGRFAKISIPTCVLHALDDPLVSWRTILSNNDSPDDVVNSGSGHVMLLLTKSGGHVGWPLGLNPALETWKWMNDAVRDYVDSVDTVLKKGKESGDKQKERNKYISHMNSHVLSNSFYDYF